MKNEKVKWSLLDSGKWLSEEQFDEKVPEEIREELVDLWEDAWNSQDEWERVDVDIAYHGGYKFTMWTEWVDLCRFGTVVKGSDVVRTFNIEEDERA